MTQIDLASLILLMASVNISFLVGKWIGIQNTLDYLEQEDILKFDE